jgi:hypothetical protein
MHRAEIVDRIDCGPGVWNRIRVGVIRIVAGQEERVGEYIRNDPALLNTFFPFQSGGEDLALYSPEYVV